MTKLARYMGSTYIIYERVISIYNSGTGALISWKPLVWYTHKSIELRNTGRCYSNKKFDIIWYKN
jgi:hypothetical protein